MELSFNLVIKKHTLGYKMLNRKLNTIFKSIEDMKFGTYVELNKKNRLQNSKKFIQNSIL